MDHDRVVVSSFSSSSMSKEMQYILLTQQQKRKNNDYNTTTPSAVCTNNIFRKEILKLDNHQQCSNYFANYEIMLPSALSNHDDNDNNHDNKDNIPLTTGPLIAPNHTPSQIQSNSHSPDKKVQDTMFFPTIITSKKKEKLHVSIIETMFRSEKSNQLMKCDFMGNIFFSLENNNDQNPRNKKDQIAMKTEIIDEKLILKQVMNTITKQSIDSSSNEHQNHHMLHSDIAIPNTSNLLSPVLIGSYTCIDTFRPMIIKAKSSIQYVTNTSSNTNSSNNKVMKIVVNLLINVKSFPQILRNIAVKVSIGGLIDKLPASFSLNHYLPMTSQYDAAKGIISWMIDTLDPTKGTNYECSVDIQCQSKGEGARETEGEGEEQMLSSIVEKCSSVILTVSVKAEYQDVLLTHCQIKAIKNHVNEEEEEGEEEDDIIITKTSQIEYRFI